MSQHTLIQKLEILSDAAKYDASCASSGTTKRNSADGKGLGSTEGHGICHAYAPDGRCISLLKILMTNFCIYDCVFCINRASSNVQRARFTVEEVVTLTLDFYRRNYIEGLFLSSGIIKSSDKTMEDMLRIVKELRTVHNFRGYIHLKTIPGAAQALLTDAGLYADRLSINIEMPSDISLQKLAPEKDVIGIKQAMAGIRTTIEEAREPTLVTKRQKVFVPAGQSTQMIIGADSSNDATVLKRSASLYGGYKLKRVYYSAFSPIPDASKILPLVKPPLVREHRLYQADWLMRFYGFNVDEITATADGGMLDLAIDPKLAWSLKNRQHFPLDVQTAAKEMLLRVPGFGVKTVKRILLARRATRLGFNDMLRMGAIMSKAKPFVVLKDWHPGKLGDVSDLRARFVPPAEQLPLFQ
jgi:putative DNA modification/repair radical SAM protein